MYVVRLELCTVGWGGGVGVGYVEWLGQVGQATHPFFFLQAGSAKDMLTLKGKNERKKKKMCLLWICGVCCMWCCVFYMQ